MDQLACQDVASVIPAIRDLAQSQSYKAAQPPVFAAATAIDAIHTPVLYLRQIGNLVFTPPFSMDRSAR
jgi:hypothetical protein